MTTTDLGTHYDVTSHIAGLYVYPIKSCAGVALSEALLLPTGLELDRAWMLVNEAHEFVTQRELPRMALITPQLKTEEMLLRAPGMLTLHVHIAAVEKPMQVRVWDDTVRAYDMGDVAAQWFSDFLGRKLRLVRFDPAQQRLSSKKWTGEIDAPNQFSDGYPVLVVGSASLLDLNQRLQAAGHSAVSMARFRPNIVLDGLDAHDEDRVPSLQLASEPPATLQLVKPCARCPVPNIDPQTAQSHPAVGDTLATYRADARLNGAITFGMNAVLTTQGEHTLRVGDAVMGNLAFG
jgi:uncharacterized protein